jgi:1,4-dihydroxy-6-naphthoate synthase
MFAPIVHRKIDLRGYEFYIVMEDVEYLNKSALKQSLDITKLSFNAFSHVDGHYQLLQSGSALGHQCGPLLISQKPYAPEEVGQLKIAVPGYHTTAYMLLKYAFPDIQHTEELLFSDIEQAVLSGQVDAGVIIHENRFTYSQKGLHKIMDLGEFWENRTGTPIPLGGIAVRRALPEEVKKDVDQIIFDSVAYAMDHPDSGWEFIRCHAQEMDNEVMKSHIQLYVNAESRRLSDKGKQAIYTLYDSQHKSADKTSLFVSR